MKYTLRDYQSSAKRDVYLAIKKGCKRVIVWITTGGGKGLLMPDYAMDALNKDKKVLVVMRRRDLIFQTRDNFKKYRDINASIIMGKEKGYDKYNPVQICSIDTIRNKIKKEEYQYLKDFDLIEIDECHDTTSPSYDKLFQFLGDKIYIGFTATPFAIGNKPLLFWDKTVKPINPSELRDQGFLAPCRFFRPGIIDTSGIKKANGDYSVSDLYEVVSDLKIVGDAIDSYKKFGNDKPFIGFCVNKAHSRLMAHAFSDAGIPAIHIDESHNKKERDKAKKDIESGIIKGIFNVNIFSTGWDCPMIEVMIGLRPTLSEILTIQQWGRVLRTFPGKECAIILDHANNSSRFGFPYDDNRIACLTYFANDYKKKESRKDEIKVKDCPECAATIESHLKECPYCGHRFAPIDRDIKQEDGVLVEVDQTEIVDKRLKKIQSHFNTLLDKERNNGWKKPAKYFLLHDKFGSEIFNYMDELGIPKWIEGAIKKNASVKKCKNCKYFRPSKINVYDSKFMGHESKIKYHDLGLCLRKNGATVKKEFFCIKFRGKNDGE